MANIALVVSGNEITDLVRAALVQGDGRPAPDSSFGIYEQRANLVTNGGFETDTSGWDNAGSAAILTRDTTTSKFGAACCKIATPATTNTAILLKNPAVPGTVISQTYTFSVWLRGTPGKLVMLNISDSYTDTNSADITLSAVWTRYTLTKTWSSVTANPAILRIFTRDATGGDIYVDGVMFNVGSVALPYCEGTIPACRVQAPATSLNTTQGGVVVRLRMGFASTNAAMNNQYVAELFVDGNNRMAMLWNGAGFQIYSIGGGALPQQGSPPVAFNVGDVVTVAYFWTAGDFGVSVNGAAFTKKGSRTATPIGTPISFDIGSAEGAVQINSDVLWAATFTGTLTDADAKRIHDTIVAEDDPGFGLFGNIPAAQPTGIWPARDTKMYLPDPSPRRIARAKHRLQIAWNAYSVGLIGFDRSNFDGTDVFGITPLDITFGGTYDDVSSRLAGARVERGRDNNLDLLLAGSATFDLRDPAGIFNPDNITGPLYGQLEDRLHPAKWEATTALGKRGLFAGWARRFVWEPQGRKGITRVECVDAFYWLAGVYPVIASTGATTTGAAIGKILDAAGLVDAAMRSLDAGDNIPDFSADGTKTALELIQALLESERGVFYISGGGKATYRSRLTRLTKTSSATFDHRVYAVAPGVDHDHAKTRVTVQRVDALGAVTYTIVKTSTGGTLQKQAYRDLPTIQTRYLNSNAQADELCAWVLSQVESPKPPMFGFKLDGRDQDLLDQIIDRDLVDRITANTPRGNTQGDFHIDRLSINLDKRGLVSADWTLSRASALNPIRYDFADFAGGYAFVY